MEEGLKTDSKSKHNFFSYKSFSYFEEKKKKRKTP